MGERAPPAGRRTQLMSLLVLEKRAQEVTLDRGLLAWRSAEPQPRKGRGDKFGGTISCVCYMVWDDLVGAGRRIVIKEDASNVLYQWRVPILQAQALVSKPSGDPSLGCCYLTPESYAVPISEIIAVEEKEREAKRSHPGRWQKMAMPHAFTVYYVKRAHHHCWQCSELTFWCTDEHLCNQWICTLKELLDLQTSRPKHLLVYINPHSGKSQGGRVYEQKVAPLFSLASISTDVIVTEHANHAKDNLLEVHLEKYDGVVCVGGDGMFSEVIHGLIGRSQKDSGIDQNNPKAQLVQCNIKIGIIPADCVMKVCHYCM